VVAHRSVFEGVAVALVTLFDDEGEIDAPATADHAARLVDEGVRAVLVAGTTGEAATLDAEERSDLLLAVRSAVDGQVPVLAGTGAPSARQAVLLSKRAEDDGADALVVLSPPRAIDPRPYYERVVASVSVPVIAYHYPKVSSPGVPVDVLAELPVAGIKDSSGDAERLLLEADALSAGVYTGSTALVHLAAAVGCAGAILGVANVDPEGCARAWLGDGDCQRELINGHRAQSLGGIARP
jgi:4-hydroxy-tetrahydrodipicolinate synthase